MNTIRITLWGLLLGLSLLWVAANLPLPETVNLMAARTLLIQYSGVLAIGAMSVAMTPSGCETSPGWCATRGDARRDGPAG